MASKGVIVSGDLPLPPGEPLPPPSPHYGQPQPQGTWQQSGPPQFTAPPKKKSSTGKIIALVVGGVVLLGILCVVGVVLFAVNVYGDRVENAKVGDCLPASVLSPSTPLSDSNKVDCASADAAHRVVGIVRNKTRTEFDTEEAMCNVFATADNALWIGAEGKAGTVFCLEPVTK
jgi:hypothetical protein